MLNQFFKSIINFNAKKLPLPMVEEPILSKEEIDSNNASLFLSENNQEAFSQLIASGYKATHQDLDKLLQNLHYKRMQLTPEIKEYIDETFDSLNSFYKKELHECVKFMETARVSSNDFNFQNFERVSSLVHVAVRMNSLESDSKPFPTEKICTNKELYDFYTKAHSFLYVCHYDYEYSKKYKTYTDFNSYKAMDIWCTEDGLKFLDKHTSSIKFELAVEHVTKIREKAQSNSSFKPS